MSYYIQRHTTSVIVLSSTEQTLCFLVNELKLLYDLLKMNAGCFGGGRLISLFNIKTMVDIVGLSIASSCTHNSPI